MSNQPLTAYRQAAEFAMRIQLETLRLWVNLWINPWRMAMEAAVASGRTEPVQTKQTEPVQTMQRRRLRNSEAPGVQYKSAQAAEGARIQVREEELRAHKQRVETGEVRVHKEVVTEHRTIEVPVQREEIVIERHAPTGEHVGEIRIPVSEEQVTVEKQPVVKEEVTLSKRVVQDTERIGGEVHKEVVHVEREGDVDIHEIGTE